MGAMTEKPNPPSPIWGSHRAFPKRRTQRRSTGRPIRRPTRDYIARFTAPEFTSICPVTGQPDFAHLVIDYAPDKWLVESKSLKLYLASFRNHGAFHEDCTVRIGKDLVGLIKPRWLRIGGYWFPRGGIPIDVFWQSGRRRKACGCPTKALRPIAGAADEVCRQEQCDFRCVHSSFKERQARPSPMEPADEPPFSYSPRSLRCPQAG